MAGIPAFHLGLVMILDFGMILCLGIQYPAPAQRQNDESGALGFKKTVGVVLLHHFIGGRHPHSGDA